jgi:hypothetical protein
MEPGALMTLRAVLTEYGVPVDHRAAVDVEVGRPDGSSTMLALAETEPGAFEGSLVAAQDGVYGFHVRATGGTMRGEPFTREQLLSAAVVRGGDRPPPRSDPSRDDEIRSLCALVACLLEPDRLGRVLERRGVDVARVRECVDAWCRRRLGPASAEELRAREGAPSRHVQRQAETVTMTNEMIATLAEILQHAERERPVRDEPRGTGSNGESIR